MGRIELAPACINSSPGRGGGPAKLVEGHVQGITTPEGQDHRSVPLHHPSDGSPPHYGEDLQPPNPSPPEGGEGRKVATLPPFRGRGEFAEIKAKAGLNSSPIDLRWGGGSWRDSGD